MSFDDVNSKPKLVEGKMIDRISRVQKMIKEQNKTLTQEMGESLWKFILNNIGFIILLVFIIIILYYRYHEVQNNRKNKKNKSE